MKMNANQADLLRSLRESEWTAVVAMPVQNNRKILLDVVFSTTDGEIAVSGKAHSLSDGSEAFSLDVYQHHGGGWWAAAANDQNTWVPRSITDEIAQGPHIRLMSTPRTMRFFSRPEFDRRVYPKAAALDDCCAIGVSQSAADRSALVLLASVEYPCAVEFFIGESACSPPLEGLREIQVW